MSLKPLIPSIVPISQVDKLKDAIKLLEKENENLQSDLGRFTQEKEDLKINLNQKREHTLKVVEVAQDEHNKRRKVDEALKGNYVGLSTKKNQLAKTQCHARKVVTSWKQTLKSSKEMEESYEGQLKELRDQLKDFKEQLKKEKINAKKLEVSLYRRQCDLEKVFEEIIELKGKAH